MLQGRIGLSDLIGKGFKLQGRGPQLFDCWGLVREMQRRRGILLPDEPTEELSLRAAMIERLKSTYCEPLARPEPYCVVVFSGPHLGWHVGTVLDDCRRFIHVGSLARNVRIDNLDDWPWCQRLYGLYRCKNNDSRSDAQ